MVLIEDTQKNSYRNFYENFSKSNFKKFVIK